MVTEAFHGDAGRQAGPMPSAARGGLSPDAGCLSFDAHPGHHHPGARPFLVRRLVQDTPMIVNSQSQVNSNFCDWRKPV